MKFPGSDTSFARSIIRWQRRHGRHDLPWQQKSAKGDPYRVWLSEIMLQQTQVATVIPYYERFVARYPDIDSLAAAPVEDVMALWSGLGYYARARNLHKAARMIVAEPNGRFPRQARDIEALPGVGRSSAAAIAVFSYGARAPILDGNVRRVLARCFGIEGFPGAAPVSERLWRLAESLLPQHHVVGYTQGLMDLGATICVRTRPACADCPVAPLCLARREGRVAARPTPRPKKDRPQRKATLIVLRHCGRILLQPRPPTGVWGGLLSLPELPDHGLMDARAFAAQRYGCDVGAINELARVNHAFTHFRLEILPLLCEVTQERPTARQDGCVWLAGDDLACAALPAPIRKILESVIQPARAGRETCG
jgi:A/G-specific adenine glycosylase